MAESSFNRKLRHNLELLSFKVFRVESHATSPGIPDNHWLLSGPPYGTSGWIEVKESSAVNPKTVEYRPQQVPWILDYCRAGGRCCTLVHIPKTEEVLYIEGRYAKAASIDLRSTPVHRLDLRDNEVWAKIGKLLRLG